MRPLALVAASLVACSTRPILSPLRLGPDGGAAADSGPDAGSANAAADAGNPGTTATDGGTDAGSAHLPSRPSVIAAENAKSGSTGWQLQNYTRQVSLYAGAPSAAPGETVSVHAAGASASTLSWELWRLGYYGGAGGRRVASGGGAIPLPVSTPGILDPTTGAVRAGWPTTFSFTVPPDAVTGVYLIKVTTPIGDAWAPLVVRESSPGAPILYPLSTNTYQAYNDWGGTSLYVNRRSDWGPAHAYAVSFERPYVRGNGTGDLLGKDLPFIQFAEGQGYDVAYVADADLDRDPQLAAGRRMLAMQGHSEYWTAGMRDAVQGAIAAGVNAAFFAANNSYWQVRFADASRLTLIGYKEYASSDPANATDPPHVTTRFRDLPVGRPENGMIGEMYGTWMWTAAPLRVSDPSSWLWTGTGVTQDSIIVGAYGDEVDRRFDNGAQPAGIDVVASGLVEGYNAALDSGESTLYTAPSGALVFSAGSIAWSRLLTESGKWDPRVQQLVANLFSRFAGDGTLGPAALKQLSLPPGASQPDYCIGATVSTITTALVQPTAVAVAPNGDAIVADQDRILRVTPTGAVTLVSGGEPGSWDGPVSEALFRAPRGLAVTSTGDIYVSDTGNHRIRLISNGVVSTVAGSQQGFRDGVGAQAMFSQPMGIAWSQATGLLIADSWNHRLRALGPGNVVTTWAGTGSDGVADGPGAQAVLNFPFSVAILPTGDAVIAEPGTGVVRKVALVATHDVSRLAGQVGAQGWDDGLSGSAGVSETLSVAARPNGDVVLLDGATSRVRVLRSGRVQTAAGGLRGGTIDGTGSAAGFGWPRGVAVTKDGSLLVVDVREHALRKITLP